MPRKSNLIQRNGRWYFNRALPKDLWPQLGKSPFRVALQTDSLEIALRRRPEAERRYYAAIDEARAATAARTPRQLSEFEATALATRWFRQELIERSRELEKARGPHLDIDAELESLNEYEAETREALAEGDLHVARAAAERFLKDEGFEVDRKSPVFRTLQMVLLRARRELALMEKARLLGDYAAKPGDPLFITAFEELDDKPQRTIDDLIEAHKTDKVANASRTNLNTASHKSIP